MGSRRPSERSHSDASSRRRLALAHPDWNGLRQLDTSKVQPIYFVELAILAIGFARMFLTASESWLRNGRAIVCAFKQRKSAVWGFTKNAKAEKSSV